MTATHSFLRVLESVRSTDGSDGFFKLYWELGTRIHQDKNYDFKIEDALSAVGLDESHASAFGDDAWDDEIRTRMDAGLAIVGTDVGTPIIAMNNDRGEQVGYFGPVINKVPEPESSLAMWDALVAMMNVDSFFELKRTRDGDLDFGDRPNPV